MSNLAKYRFYFNNDNLTFKARKSSRKSSRKVSKRTSSKKVSRKSSRKVSKRTSSKKVSKRKSSKKVSKRTSSKKVSKRKSSRKVSKRTSSKTSTCSSRNKNNCYDDKCHWQKYNGCKNRRSKSIRRLNELMAGDNGAVPKFFLDQEYLAKKTEEKKKRADAKQKENAVAVEQVADDDAAKMAKLGADAGLWFKSRKSSKRKSSKRKSSKRKSSKRKSSKRKSSKRKSSTKNRANRRTIEEDECINRSGNEQLCGYEPNCEWVDPTQSCRLRKLSRSSRGKVAYEGPMGPPLAFKSKKSRKSGKKSRKSGKKSRKMRKVRKVSRK